MDKFGYPTNIKQIGDVDDNLRIYIEDYVYTYLLQYGEAGGNEERVAALVGRCMIMDGVTTLFINGAIQGKYAETDKGITTFSKKSYEYIDNQVDKYFKGLEVVGWLQSQPNYGNFLSASYADYHINNFKKSYQVMLVTDPIEKINSFFIWNSDKTDIEEAKGFFIFYDKNKNMHNYILDNKIVKFNKPEPMETIERTITIEEDDDEPFEKTATKPKTPKKDIKFINTSPSSSKNKDLYKKFATPVAGVIAVASILLATSISTNNNRINKLETEINSVRTAYNELVTYINEQGAVAVFADSTSQNGTTITETTVVVEPVSTKAPEQTPTPTPVPTPEPAKSQAPKSSTSSIETSIPKTYIVRQGDSLINITKAVYGSDAMLPVVMEANGITDPNKIYFGMVLDLPEKTN